MIGIHVMLGICSCWLLLWSRTLAKEVFGSQGVTVFAAVLVFYFYGEVGTFLAKELDTIPGYFAAVAAAVLTYYLQQGLMSLCVSDGSTSRE